MRPLEPPRRGGPAPTIPGAAKVEPADFRVDEELLYTPSGAGEHLYVQIEKIGVTTLAAASRLAEAAGVNARSVGFAGMKDARAVTRQWLSMAGVAPESVLGWSGDGVRVLQAVRHTNKLKLGHLRGNRFDILVRGPSAEHVDAARTNLQAMARHGAPNFFGEQRFGRGGGNLDEGLSILRGNPRRAARGRAPRVLDLLLSAVQSEVFNRVLARRIDSIDRLESGDVAWLHRNGACFLVVDGAAEQERCASFEISPTGPLPGPRTLPATGRQGDLEAEVMAEMEIDPAVFGRMKRITPGARRPLRVPVRDPEVIAEEAGLRLRFGLPKGSYATVVLRELLDDLPWFPQGVSG